MALRLKNSSGNYIALDAPSSIASDVTLTLPNTDGDSGQYLQTDGSGGLSWQTVSSLSNAEDGAGTDFEFNSGYGSNATAYGCRAWVNFNGTGTVAIRDSGNVSSITDRGTGQYTVNFTNAMPDINYCAVPSGNPTWGSSYNSSVIIDGPGGTTGTTTSACQIHSRYSSGGGADANVITLAVFR